VRLGSLKGLSARAPAELGPLSVDKGQGPLRQNISPLLAPVMQKRLALVSQEPGVCYGISFHPVFGFQFLPSHEPLPFSTCI
jgi:hypothetical protein